MTSKNSCRVRPILMLGAFYCVVSGHTCCSSLCLHYFLLFLPSSSSFLFFLPSFLHPKSPLVFLRILVAWAEGKKIDRQSPEKLIWTDLWVPNDYLRLDSALSYPPSLPQAPRGYSEVIRQYGSEDPRRQSQPSYDPYGAPGPPDPVVKKMGSAAAERSQLQDVRTHSTGILMDGRPKPPHDLRPQVMPGCDSINIPPGSPPTIHHVPQQQPLAPPQQYIFHRPMYDQPNPEGLGEPIYPEYIGTVSSSQKKRPPRTLNVCHTAIRHHGG